MISSPTLAYSLDSLHMNYEINQTQKKVKARLTKILKQDLEEMCPMMVAKEEKEGCTLQLRVEKIGQGESVTVAVQYTSSDIVLFDGIAQRVQGRLSSIAGKHFYYALNRENTVTVFIRSKSHTLYRVLGAIIDVSEFSRSPYPAHSSNSSLSTVTTQSGQTALVVPSLAIFNNRCQECLLLLTVFAKGTDSPVDFKIEVSQAVVAVQQGETRQGYVEKDTSVKYQIVAQAQEETVVTLNSMHVDCAKLEAFSRLPESLDTKKFHNSTGGNYFVLEKPEQTTIYTIHVTGVSSCAYQISFTSTQERLYELGEGVAVDIFLEK